MCLSACLSPADNVVVYANVLTGSSSKLENVQLQKNNAEKVVDRAKKLQEFIFLVSDIQILIQRR